MFTIVLLGIVGAAVLTVVAWSLWQRQCRRPSVTVTAIDREQRAAWQPRLAALEAQIRYPLGDDHFTISHGRDYFRFFDGLGLYNRFFVATVENELVGVGCVVRQDVRFRRSDEHPRQAWYACDVKVAPRWRGRGVVMEMFRQRRHAFMKSPGYMVCMDHADGTEGRIVTLCRKYGPVMGYPFTTPRLAIYKVDAVEMARLAHVVHDGPVGYVSLRGVKDLTIDGEAAPMPVLHVVFGDGHDRGLQRFDEPQPGYDHMFCACMGSHLQQTLTHQHIWPTATATIVAYGMASSDFAFISTASI
jgi:hypothetical protein